MIAVDLALRWMHIFGAIILVGGAIYMRCVYTPCGSAPDDSAKGGGAGEDAGAAIRRRWAKLVMLSTAFLLISGLINFILIMQRYEILDSHLPGRAGYQMVFGIKFLLALAVFFISALLSGRSGLAVRIRQREKLWLNVNLALAVVVVMLAGVMKIAARAPRPVETAQGGRIAVEGTAPQLPVVGE